MPHECTTCGRTFPDGSKEMLGGCPDCGGNKFQFAPSLETRSSAAGPSHDADPGDSDPGPGGHDSDPGDHDVDSGPDVDSGRDVRANADSSARSRRSGGDPQGGDGEWKRAWPDSGRRPENRSTAGHEDGSTADHENRSAPSPEDGSTTEPEPEPKPGSAERSTEVQPDATNGSVDARSEPADADREDAAQANARSGVVPTDELPPADEIDRPDAERGRVVSEPTEEQPSLDELREELNQQFESIKIVTPGRYELNLMELYNRDEHIISLQEDGRYVIDVPDSWHQSEE